MDGFLDSCEPEFSDFEDNNNPDLAYPVLRAEGSPLHAKTVIISAGPETLSVSHLIGPDTVTSMIYLDSRSEKAVGRIHLLADQTVLITLGAPQLFSLHDLVDKYDKLIVLTSMNSTSQNGVYVVGIDNTVKVDSNLSQLPCGLTGMAAHFLTESMIDGQNKCTVIVNVHTSIRVELDGLIDMWQAISRSGLVNDSQPQSEQTIISEFKKKYPVNRKFPLYS